MLQNYEKMVRTCYAPLMQQYGLEFASYDNDEFFLIGNGFALYTFIDRRDMRGDTWYVSLSKDGTIREHTLMYISRERFTQQDRAVAGKPETVDEYIEATFKVKCFGFLNHCADILSGDTEWLQGYPDQGGYNRHITRFLAPYFERQGHYVKPMEE